MKPSTTLSVVIAAKNCEDRIKGTVEPWQKIAHEIIVMDQMSGDSTAKVAEQMGCKVFRNQPANGNFDLNRKIGMQKAQSDWILYIDTDERPTQELLVELKEFLADENAQKGIDGVRVPNEFWFLGKPLRHGIFNPRTAAEVRMVRRSGGWSYPCEEGYHRGVSVSGGVIRLKNPYRHFNVNSLGEWFFKTQQYTEHDAHENFKAGRKSKKWGAVFNMFRFFLRHYFWKLGLLDGFRGFVSVFYFMLYHFTLEVKTWELEERSTKKEGEDFLSPFVKR